MIYSGAGGSYNDAVTVWNIHTLTPYDINVEGYGNPYSRNPACPTLAISPDNRHLVIASTTIRVWDLWNLPEIFEDRLPIYRHEATFHRIGCIRFLDNDIVETISADGTYYWNIHTGEIVALE